MNNKIGKKGDNQLTSGELGESGGAGKDRIDEMRREVCRQCMPILGVNPQRT